MIASGMDGASVTRALADVRGGRSRIVLCSPERFASASFMDALAARRVDLFAVDEAHCVSEWGHDFRPDYLRLRSVIDRLGSPTVMACTATATEEVADEILTRLGLRDPVVLRAGFDRPNLSFDVVGVDGAGTKAPKGALTRQALAGALRSRTGPCRRYGVFVTAIVLRVDGVWRLALAVTSSCSQIALPADVRARLAVCWR